MSNNNVKDWGEFQKLAELPSLEDLLFVGEPVYKLAILSYIYYGYYNIKHTVMYFTWLNAMALPLKRR